MQGLRQLHCGCQGQKRPGTCWKFRLPQFDLGFAHHRPILARSYVPGTLGSPINFRSRDVAHAWRDASVNNLQRLMFRLFCFRVKSRALRHGKHYASAERKLVTLRMPLQCETLQHHMEKRPSKQQYDRTRRKLSATPEHGPQTECRPRHCFIQRICTQGCVEKWLSRNPDCSK